MLRFGCVLRKLQVRSASGSSASACTKEVAHNLPAPQLEETFQLIGKLSTRELCKPGSTELVKLGRLIDGVQGGNDMRKVRNKILRTFSLSYNAVYSRLKGSVVDPELFEMSMYRKLGPKQYMSFIKALRSTIKRKDMSVEAKKERLYRIISFQHELYPEASKKNGFMIVDDVHQWFWEKLSKAESFGHYYFLIKNDVHLSSSPYLWNFTKRLMQGSEMELQLATFQIFLHDQSHQATFHNKFTKLYSFGSMILLVNKILCGKDLRFIKVYLAALLHKMELLKTSQGRTASNRLHFVHFSNTLLYYLSQTANIEMFLETFEIQLKHMRRVGLLDDPKETFRLLQRPLNFVLKLLRQRGLQEEVFRFISIINRVCVSRNRDFNDRVAVELLSSLRSFNDPKLTCQYIISAFKDKQTAELLNELGLWGAAFHQSPQRLPEAALRAEAHAHDDLVPDSLQIGETPTIAVLTECYRVILFTNAKTMGSEEYEQFLLDLYKNYKKALQQNRFRGAKHDTGILSIFLHNIRLELKNSKLAYEILKDFYAQRFASNVRITSKVCPFSLVAYKNYEITQAEVSDLLSIMQSNGISLHLRFCVAMVLRFLKLNNLVEARSWYDKILHASFDVRHTLLIKAIRDNGWDYPKNFDMSLLDEIDNPSTTTSDDALFLEGSNNFGGSEIYSENTEEPLLEVIDLVEELAKQLPSKPIPNSL